MTFGTLINRDRFAEALWYERDLGLTIIYLKSAKEMLEEINARRIRAVIVSREFDQLGILKTATSPFALLHLSDEAYSWSKYRDLYSLPQVSTVIRNYSIPSWRQYKASVPRLIRHWTTRLLSRNGEARSRLTTGTTATNSIGRDIRTSVTMLGRQIVCTALIGRMRRKEYICIPLGVTNKFWEAKARSDGELPSIAKRNLAWSFAGCLNSSARAQMLKELKGFGPAKVRLLRDWGQTANDALSGDEYLAWLCQSRFVPCPMGWFNVESFRWVEAVEAGAIPVLVRGSIFQPFDCFAYLGDNPLPIFDGWPEASRWMKDNRDNDRLEELGQAIADWYSEYKARLKRVFRS